MATRFPEWIRRKWASGEDFDFTQGVLRDLGVHTVCQSARCPNRAECWQRRTATLMIAGDVCTRNCAFCAVTHGNPRPLDPAELWNVARAVRELGLAHAVLTSVTRDDLPDGGAAHMASTIEAIRMMNPGTTIEALVPDFQGDAAAIDLVLEAGPNVFAHNIETVRRLYPVVRDRRSSYTRSLDVLRHAAKCSLDVVVKSAFMVGHGETEDEVRETLEDLRDAGCLAVSIGQYLQPTGHERPVAEFVSPVQFQAYRRMADALGFACVAAGPFVRSSYHSDDLWSALSAPGKLPARVGRMIACATK